MTPAAKPSLFHRQLALVLDDNINVPIGTVLAFEQALSSNPNDTATRQAYHDWLVDHGCVTRAEQLAAGLLDQTPGEFRGAVRPESTIDGRAYQPNWFHYCGLPEAERPSADWQGGFNYAMSVIAFWLDFQQGVEASRRQAEGGDSVWGMKGPGFSAVGMRKSALLGRLMRGEELRRRPCPRHRGIMWCSWGLDEASRACPCDGTGWLPNDYDGPMPEPRESAS